MKRSIFIPMSKDNTIKTERTINKILSEYQAMPDLCTATDPYKYMVVYDDTISHDNMIPDLGVRIVKGSEDFNKTEKKLNKVMEELRLDDNKAFISICNPSDFIYIILYQYKAGYFPIISIVPIIGDLRSAQKYLDKKFEEYDELELDLCDHIKLDDNHLMFLLLPR